MHAVGLVVVIQSELRSQLGRRFNIGARGLTTLIADRGQLRIAHEPAADRDCLWLEPNGRFVFAHSPGDARCNGRELPGVGVLLRDGDLLGLGGMTLRMRITDDLEAAYHEVIHTLEHGRARFDRHAN